MALGVPVATQSTITIPFQKHFIRIYFIAPATMAASFSQIMIVSDVARQLFGPAVLRAIIRLPGSASVPNLDVAVGCLCFRK